MSPSVFLAGRLVRFISGVCHFPEEFRKCTGVGLWSAANQIAWFRVGCSHLRRLGSANQRFLCSFLMFQFCGSNFVVGVQASEDADFFVIGQVKWSLAGLFSSVRTWWSCMLERHLILERHGVCFSLHESVIEIFWLKVNLFWVRVPMSFMDFGKG